MCLYIRSLVVGEEWMRPGHCLGLVLCVQCVDIDGWSQEGHTAHIKPIPLIPKGSLQEQAVEEDPRRNWLAQVQRKKTAVK